MCGALCAAAGRSSSTASVGGRDNNAGFLSGGGAYDCGEEYGDDVPRCTVDVSGAHLACFQRRVPGAHQSRRTDPQAFSHTPIHRVLFRGPGFHCFKRAVECTPHCSGGAVVRSRCDLPPCGAPVTDSTLLSKGHPRGGGGGG